MAQRRMFSLKVVDTDDFLDMPQTTQLLYFHFAMRADDDGFVCNPKKIITFVHANDDDFKILVAKQYIIPFQSGIIVIRHWNESNYIAKDRYHPTVYQKEFAELTLEDNLYTKCIQPVYEMDTQVRLGKDRLVKDKIVKNKERAFAPPSFEEVLKYCKERKNKVSAQNFIDFYTAKNWMIGKNKMKDWRAAVRTWEARQKEESQNQPNNQRGSEEWQEPEWMKP